MTIFSYNTFLDILAVFVLLSAIHGIFLSVQIFTKTNREKSNYIFAILLLIISLHLLEVLVGLRGYTYLVPHLDGATFPLIFALGPLYYLYVKFLTEPNFNFRYYHIIHFIPSLFMIYLLLPYYLTDAQIKSESLKQFAELIEKAESVTLSSYLAYQLIFHAVQLSSYLVVSYILVSRFKLKVQKNTSGADAIQKISWLEKTTLVFGVYTSGYLIMLVSLISFGSYYLVIDTTWLFLVSLFIHFAGYAVIRQPKFSEDELLEMGHLETEDNIDKYKSSSLTEEEINNIHSRLVNLMEIEKPYLNDKIRLNEVAGKLDITPHKLSQVINQKEELNFFEFVNKYRIKESIRLMQADQSGNKKILAIAFESGFNNKVSFNRTFKKITGKTPTQFKISSKKR